MRGFFRGSIFFASMLIISITVTGCNFDVSKISTFIEKVADVVQKVGEALKGFSSTLKENAGKNTDAATEPKKPEDKGDGKEPVVENTDVAKQPEEKQDIASTEPPKTDPPADDSEKGDTEKKAPVEEPPAEITPGNEPAEEDGEGVGEKPSAEKERGVDAEAKDPNANPLIDDIAEDEVKYGK